MSTETKTTTPVEQYLASIRERVEAEAKSLDETITREREWGAERLQSDRLDNIGRGFLERHVLNLGRAISTRSELTLLLEDTVRVAVDDVAALRRWYAESLSRALDLGGSGQDVTVELAVLKTLERSEAIAWSSLVSADPEVQERQQDRTNARQRLTELRSSKDRARKPERIAEVEAGLAKVEEALDYFTDNYAMTVAACETRLRRSFRRITEPIDRAERAAEGW